MAHRYHEKEPVLRFSHFSGSLYAAVRSPLYKCQNIAQTDLFQKIGSGVYGLVHLLHILTERCKFRWGERTAEFFLFDDLHHIRNGDGGQFPEGILQSTGVINGQLSGFMRTAKRAVYGKDVIRQLAGNGMDIGLTGEERCTIRALSDKLRTFLRPFSRPDAQNHGYDPIEDRADDEHQTNRKDRAVLLIHRVRFVIGLRRIDLAVLACGFIIRGAGRNTSPSSASAS